MLNAKGVGDPPEHERCCENGEPPCKRQASTCGISLPGSNSNCDGKREWEQVCDPQAGDKEPGNTQRGHG